MAFPTSPFEWGKSERERALVGDAFDLEFEQGTCVYYERDGEAAWNAFVSGGPVTPRSGATRANARARRA